MPSMSLKSLFWKVKNKTNEPIEVEEHIAVVVIDEGVQLTRVQLEVMV